MSPGPDSDDGSPLLPPAETIRADQTLKMDRSMIERYQQSNRKGSLLVIAGAPADVGMHRLVEGEVVMGRSPEVFQLRDGQISWRHAAVAQQEGRYVVRDLGSTNGTLLNGVQVTQARDLQDGDQIRLGATVIKFTLVDETEADYLRRIARLAGTDALTGLIAKHRFDALLELTVEDARTRSVPLSALMMDMDNLKAINDRHGHQTGAGTIKQVGALIGGLVGDRGEVARFGGDEFCAYLIGSGIEGALELGEQIRAAVEAAELRVGPVTVRTSISIGVAELTDEVTGQELLGLADQALYRAKALGRNRVAE